MKRTSVLVNAPPSHTIVSFSRGDNAVSHRGLEFFFGDQNLLKFLVHAWTIRVGDHQSSCDSQGVAFWLASSLHRPLKPNPPRERYRRQTLGGFLGSLWAPPKCLDVQLRRHAEIRNGSRAGSRRRPGYATIG
jgi:hypothetical protein